jgi:hypothetical protein
MREILILAVHFPVTIAKLLRPAGVRAVAAASLLLKHQLLISSRSRKRAPNLTTLDLCSAVIHVVPRSCRFDDADYGLTGTNASEYS